MTADKVDSPLILLVPNNLVAFTFTVSSHRPPSFLPSPILLRSIVSEYANTREKENFFVRSI